MTLTLKSYVCGQWFQGTGEPTRLYNPTTEEVAAQTSTTGLNYREALAYARDKGGKALRGMTFAQRGELLMNMSKAIHEHREELLELSSLNGGTTRGDGKFDIDGATGTLGYYARAGRALGDTFSLADEDLISLTRNPRWAGRHVYQPRQGVAILINAFNFPAWGFAEKAACAILAGMPVLNKPATSTALVAARIAEILVDSGVMPEGVFSAVSGGAGDMLDHVQWQDVVAFTGSSDTGLKIRSHRAVLENNVPVNVEADSLNSAILGPEVDPDSDTYDLFLKEVVRDMTQKAGQKCTAIRRIFVPQDALDSVSEDLKEQLQRIRTGTPTLKGVTTGPLATQAQLNDAMAGLARLGECTKTLLGGERGELEGVEGKLGYFLSPTLLVAHNSEAPELHDREIFGPVATLIPYDGSVEHVTRLIEKGQGSLVSSVYSNDSTFLKALFQAIGPFLGRLHLANDKIAEHSMGPGTVLPQLMHGGPGRAGGGQELGGLSGLRFYMQRTAVQGYAPLLEKLP